MLKLKERNEVKENKKIKERQENVLEKMGSLFSERESDMERILGVGLPLEKGDYFQQGDCILAQLGDENFKDAPTKIEGDLQTSNVVLKGTLNSHALYEGSFEIFKKDEQVFVRVHTFAVLDHVKDPKARSHAEHHAQWIPKGDYFLRNIMEFDYLDNMARKVID